MLSTTSSGDLIDERRAMKEAAVGASGAHIVFVVASVVLAGLTACGTTSEEDARRPSNATASVPSASAAPSTVVPTFALEDCPVPDEAFCEAAVVTVNAIAAGDAEALVGVSGPNEYDCSGLPREFFPGCGSAEVLEGYIVSTGQFPKMTIDVLPKADYLDRLTGLFASVDAGYEDEVGDGRPSVIGVKKCGGSWTITWTAALPSGDEPAERMGAYFEFVTTGPETDDWFTEGLVLTPLHYPGHAQFDPSIDEIGCGEPTMPWPPAS
jgi:hypothetical protein